EGHKMKSETKGFLLMDSIIFVTTISMFFIVQSLFDIELNMLSLLILIFAGGIISFFVKAILSLMNNQRKDSIILFVMAFIYIIATTYIFY
ncbi:hypothetical protein, partial [Piscibacillus halophilus]|uniref:hypothetical protein n=1 Tax=Piscibacillus halophilus TaxID=571933 RepID=UPI00240963D3